MFECPVPLYRGSEVAIDGGLDILDIGQEQSSKFTNHCIFVLCFNINLFCLTSFKVLVLVLRFSFI